MGYVIIVLGLMLFVTGNISGWGFVVMLILGFLL